MKKGDIFEGKVIRTEFPNKGIIDIEGQKVIVKNALEGQVVRFSINKKKRDKIEGRLLEVIEPSPIEQPAACKHFGICGGCRYQNLSYEQQLDLKKRQVEELIEKNGLSFDIENIYGSPITEGYRNKMEFTFGDEEKDGPLALGMHKKNSFYDIVTLDDCRIVDPDFNVLLQAILKYFKEKGETYFHKIRHEGFLRHLVMRRSVKTGDILINLVTTTQSRLDESEFVNMILSQKIDGKVVGAVWTRIMNDYGHIDDRTPSFAISLYKEYRGLGIGTEMMRQMLVVLQEKGYRKASLAVQQANYAVRMYQRVGFEIVDKNEEEYIMVCNLK